MLMYVAWIFEFCNSDTTQVDVMAGSSRHTLHALYRTMASRVTASHWGRNPRYHCAHR